MYVTVTLAKPFKHLTDSEREQVMGYFWLYLPRQMAQRDANTFVLDKPVIVTP